MLKCVFVGCLLDRLCHEVIVSILQLLKAAAEGLRF
jgi:hypothetical protein